MKIVFLENTQFDLLVNVQDQQEILKQYLKHLVLMQPKLQHTSTYLIESMMISM